MIKMTFDAYDRLNDRVRGLSYQLGDDYDGYYPTEKETLEHIDETGDKNMTAFLMWCQDNRKEFELTEDQMSEKEKISLLADDERFVTLVENDEF